jgi:hypothetical protein
MNWGQFVRHTAIAIGVTVVVGGNLFGDNVSSDRSLGNSITKIARMTPTIPRGTIMGKQTSGPLLSEAEHFHKCEACGGWFDMRDLGAVLDHEEPLPHPASDQVQ